MGKTGFAFLLLTAFGLSACQSRRHTNSESRRDAMVDSMVGIRMEELNRQAMEDLDQRMSIEVKAKADSIVNAVMNPGATPTDTIKKVAKRRPLLR